MSIVKNKLGRFYFWTTLILFEGAFERLSMPNKKTKLHFTHQCFSLNYVTVHQGLMVLCNEIVVEMKYVTWILGT